jgi:hypothetical protein
MKYLSFINQIDALAINIARASIPENLKTLLLHQNNVELESKNLHTNNNHIRLISNECFLDFRAYPQVPFSHP